MIRAHTDGVIARLCGGSGGASNGESDSRLLKAALGAWCSGKEGVETLDILSWPKGHLCGRRKGANVQVLRGGRSEGFFAAKLAIALRQCGVGNREGVL